MKDGFIKVAAATVEVGVADVKNNVLNIKRQIEKADNLKVNLLTLPELCVTGCTCGDLFLSEALLDEALCALKELCGFTAGKYPVVTLGLPLKENGRIYNCVAALWNGNILGIVSKNYGDSSPIFSVSKETQDILIDGQVVPFGEDLVFKSENLSEFSFGVTIGKHFTSIRNKAEALTNGGAAVIANSSALNETPNALSKRRNAVSSISDELSCGFVYADADYSESTTDTVFSRHLIIAENGKLLAENLPFGDDTFIVSEIDVKNILARRVRNSVERDTAASCETVYFNQEIAETILTRGFDKNPFVPENERLLSQTAETVLNIQAYGLKKRVSHTNCKTLVLGISGGLDSTLALLVAARTLNLSGRPLTDILAVTMPCFGTTSRTKSNAVRLCELLGVRLKEINIANSVLSHFEDIGQDKSKTDVTFENAQARERTQVLMDIANMENGLVIGTGDLSELALGWATYNGDHMSNYSVNASVPKTLVRALVSYEAQRLGGEIADILKDILDTPVSPELLPTDNGNLSQKTEDLVGPYELHDFFLYHLVHLNESPAKIYRIATYVFGDEYKNEIILKWLKVFVRRFFTQQFKRSCMPDGPKATEVSLSPRGSLNMPTDAVNSIWLKELEEINL
ncbi:MAG: NAD(+) synthase [Clostridia bacterium]|nr:NAD(+) synthase [Clostridia bacterium]